MKTILTGIQPTNALHIGNYFGALLPMVELQEQSNLYMMIVDYHAITATQDPAALRKNILFNAAAYIAAGIDPEKATLFQQSQVLEHTELGWIMQTQTHMGEAQRMTQFKDKSKGDLNGVSIGLFTYPALMAADMLLYDTEEVPVGADQKQHLELTRDLAERFNKRFGDTFVVPKPRIKTAGARILALNDPEKKMSKSSPSAKSYISLMDDADVIAKKIRSAVTDSERTITADPERKGLYNLLTICSLASGESIEVIADRYKDAGMAGIKEATTEALVAHLAPVQMRIQELLQNEDELIKIIKDGSRKAEQRAQEKMKQVRKAIGVAL